MTSLEDWSLSTLSSHIFRQQTQLQLQSANSLFYWWQTKATATTAIWELEFWGGRPSWKMGYNCNLGTRGFLCWLGWPSSTAM